MFAMGPAFFNKAGSAYATLALTGTFAAATVGVAYSSSIPISGGLEPYSLTGGTGVASGALDSGFSLSITGAAGARFLTLSCASPATADTMAFTASVGSSDGQTATSAQSVLIGVPVFSPADLFASGERGAWYDPSDLSTMFQDTAGTVPVTAVGQQVARINDKSGNGHHATQATSGKQPYLRSDGANYYLEMKASTSTILHAPKTTALSGQSDSILCVCALVNSDYSATFLALQNDYVSERGFTLITSGGSPAMYFGVDNRIIKGNAAPSTGAVLAGYLDRATNTSQVRVNGSDRTGGVYSFNSPDRTINRGLAIGGNIHNDAETVFGSYMTGGFYGAIVRYADIHSAVTSDVETWIGAKCGLTI